MRGSRCKALKRDWIKWRKEAPPRTRYHAKTGIMIGQSVWRQVKKSFNWSRHRNKAAAITPRVRYASSLGRKGIRLRLARFLAKPIERLRQLTQSHGRSRHTSILRVAFAMRLDLMGAGKGV